MNAHEVGSRAFADELRVLAKADFISLEVRP